MATIYDYPEYYDILFGWDRDAEAQHYEHALTAHGVPRGAPIVEVAAGTAQVGIRLARNGWPVTALDLSESMLGFAAEVAARGGTAIETLVGDMTAFSTDQKYLGALNPMSSFRLLERDADVAGHLDCMADALNSGGVYLVDMAFGTDGTPSSDLDEWVMIRGEVTVTATTQDVRVVDVPRGRDLTLDWHESLRPYTPESFTGLVEPHARFTVTGCYREIEAVGDGPSSFERTLSDDLPNTGRAIVVLSRA